MFDISWSEFLLIGIVALVVIGPKELPAVMRTLGQWTRKVRSMASEFQNQFQEAMREAEMTELKKQVDDMAADVTQLDPLKGLREDVEGVGADVHRSLSSNPEATAAPPASSGESVSGEPAAMLPAAPAAAEPAPVPDGATPLPAETSDGDKPAQPIEPAHSAPDKEAESERAGLAE